MHISVKKIPTPAGDLLAGADATSTWFIEFTEEQMLSKQLNRLSKDLHAEFVFEENQPLQQLTKELEEYFNRERTEFTVPLHLSGTDFQKAVWQQLMQIPYGKTCSYKQQAIQLNNLSAIRAIASANGQNRHAIVIPCHRVIGSNGSLTGYAVGLPKKDWLLKFESNYLLLAPELPFG